MSGGASSARGTDWSAVAVSMSMPLIVAAGFAYAALSLQWAPTEDWIWGLLALVPLEFLRAFVLSILGDTFKDYQNPSHAVHAFLLSMAILAVMGLVWSLFNLGFSDTFALLSDARAHRLLALPAAILVADCAVTLYFFRGDARCEAARVQAAADDAFDWIFLAAFSLPLPLVALFTGYMILEHRDALAAWLDSPDPTVLMPPVMLYGAGYFVGKAVVLAHVHSASFNRTGQRLLSAGWIQALMWRNAKDRAKDAKSEAQKIHEREAVLEREGAPIAASPRDPAPPR